MQLKNKLFYTLGIIILLGASGCAHYRAQPLNRLVNRTPNEKTKSISFESHVFNRADCKRFLDRNVLAKKYQPIHLAFTNSTNRYFNIFKENISLPCVSADYVARKVHTSTAARVLVYGIPGLVFLPIFWPLGALIIPAVVDGVGSSQSNHKLDEDFSRKELDDQVIAPFSKAHGLIFVPMEKFDQDFEIALIDAKTHEKFVLSTSKRSLSI